MKGLDSDRGCCRSLTHRFIPIFLSFIFAVMLSAFTGEAQATCHSTCYDIDLTTSECREDGKSEFVYTVSAGVNESRSCYGINKFRLKVLNCDSVHSVQFPSGISGNFWCSDGELFIDPEGSEPDDNESRTFKVIMKTCQCATSGFWKTYAGPDNSCQFTGNTDVPGQCECLQDSDCEDDGDSCTDEVCNDDFKCDSTPNTGGSCDDENPCTNEDSCHEGECEGTPIEGCKQCEGSGECNDGNKCNGEETCGVNGTCQDGAPLVCEADTNPCTDDICDPAKGCEHPNNDDDCDDGDACTQTDTCQDGSCEGENPVVCEPPATCFKEGVCQAGSGECAYEPQDSGTSCSDPTSCNGDEICDGAGTCNPGTPVTCDCENPCEAGRCEEGEGAECVCDPVEDGTSCNDGNLCDGSNSCQDGECVDGNPVSCDDSNTCTDDSCNPETGTCTNADNNTCEPPPGCGGGDCGEGETCDTCPADCGECPGLCGNGICDPGEDCLCSDCAETESCQIRAQQLKCAQDLVAESDGRLNAQQAENLATELVAEGVPCTLILESGSGGLKVGGCALQPKVATAQAPWLGLASLLLAWMPLALLRRAKVRKR